MFMRQGLLLMKFGLNLNLKTHTQCSIKYKGTKLWNALQTDRRENYLKSCAIFVNQLKQFLPRNQL